MIAELYTNNLCSISVTPPRLEDTIWQSVYAVLSLCLYYWKKKYPQRNYKVNWIAYCIGHIVNITTMCTDIDQLMSAYFVSGVGENTNHKSSVLCNRYIIWCKYEVWKKTHCAPVAYYTLVTVCLCLEYVCRIGWYTFEEPFYTSLFFTIWCIYPQDNNMERNWCPEILWSYQFYSAAKLCLIWNNF